jgi:hypothetical protein
MGSRGQHENDPRDGNAENAEEGQVPHHADDFLQEVFIHGLIVTYSAPQAVGILIILAPLLDSIEKTS